MMTSSLPTTGRCTRLEPSVYRMGKLHQGREVGGWAASEDVVPFPLSCSREEAVTPPDWASPPTYHHHQALLGASAAVAGREGQVWEGLGRCVRQQPAKHQSKLGIHPTVDILVLHPLLTKGKTGKRADMPRPSEALMCRQKRAGPWDRDMTQRACVRASSLLRPGGPLGRAVGWDWTGQGRGNLGPVAEGHTEVQQESTWLQGPQGSL